MCDHVLHLDLILCFVSVLGRAGLLLLLELCLVWARSELPASFSPPLICLSPLSIRSHLPPSLLIICLPAFTLLHRYTIFVNCRSSSSALITLCQLFVVTFRIGSPATLRVRPICFLWFPFLSTLHHSQSFSTVFPSDSTREGANHYRAESQTLRQMSPLFP